MTIEINSVIKIEICIEYVTMLAWALNLYGDYWKMAFYWELSFKVIRGQNYPVDKLQTTFILSLKAQALVKFVPG